jgi:hypothetical protein
MSSAVHEDATNESDAGDYTRHVKDLKPFLPIPEAVDFIAKIGKVLCWNSQKKWFVVLDGPRFEEQFNAMRPVRGKRKADARMHVYFDLVRGEKWAGTGSAFRPKAHSYNAVLRECGSAAFQSLSYHAEFHLNPHKCQKVMDDQHRTDESATPHTPDQMAMMKNQYAPFLISSEVLRHGPASHEFEVVNENTN